MKQQLCERIMSLETKNSWRWSLFPSRTTREADANEQVCRGILKLDLRTGYTIRSNTRWRKNGATAL